MYFILLAFACTTYSKPDTVQSIDSANPSPVEPMSAQTFAEICKRELGLPETPLPPMQCTSGSEVHITIHGETPDAEQYIALMNGEAGCDSPSWLNSEEPCANYSFLSRYELSDSVTAMLFCRKRNFTNPLNFSERLAAFNENPSQELFEDLYYFDTIGLIWTNHETGKSCFFDNQHPNFYAGVIPSPDDPTPLTLSDFPDPKPNDSELEALLQGNQNDIWRMPFYTMLHARCHRCHDGGPFVRSPHLNELDLIPPHKSWLPHKVIIPNVGSTIEIAETTAISTTDVQTPTGTEPQLCTTCHTIGSENTCEQFIDYYTGTLAPSQNPMTSPHDLILMPPPSETDMQLNDIDYVAQWEAKVKPHLDKLKCCCDNPNATGCLQRDLRLDDPTAYTPGQGPETCE